MEDARLLIVGATGFVGRHLIATLSQRTRIHALARRSPHEVGIPEHPNVTWYQADIADPQSLATAFAAITAAGGADYVIHLAAHYDFSGEDNPEYRRTNVVGLESVLQACVALAPRRFVFASSLAACDFPAPGTVLTERSVADGRHPYARSKRQGEELIAKYRTQLRSVIVRLGAVFSDWCEFLPVFMLFNTWLTPSWKARVLGGNGSAALPYIHVRDCVSFIKRLIDRDGLLGAGEVLIAGTEDSVSQRQLFDAACHAYFGHRVEPRLMPKIFARLGIHVLDVIGHILGERPFERPWMADYIDRAMRVDMSYTRQRLGWAPNPRFGLLRRMPFIIENLKTNPIEWNRKNLAKVKAPPLAHHLQIFKIIDDHEEELVQLSVDRCLDPELRARYPLYSGLPREDLVWAARQSFLHLKSAVRTREKAIFQTYCAECAVRRFQQGFSAEEVVAVFELKLDLALSVLLNDPSSRGLDAAIHDTVNMTFRIGIDQVLDTFEEAGAQVEPSELPRTG
jgi:nucleoside-diphosphate-sugar epimerase